MESKENYENPPPLEQKPGKQDIGTKNSENQHAGENKSLSALKPVTTESGGRGGLDPTRFGDWEIAGKCVDF